MKKQAPAFFQHLSLSRRPQKAVNRMAFFFFLALCLSFPATAQFTIGNAVFPVAGETLHFAFGNQPGAINQIFTPPGGNQQWDLSNLQPTQSWDQVMKNPQTGTAAAAFPQASILFNPLNSNDEVYLQVTGNQVNELGYYGLDKLGLGLTLLFKNVPALEQSWAPVNFFDIHQSASNVLTAFDAPIAPPLLLALAPTADSFRIRVTQQRIATIDAWGTLAIPGGTFEVIRKKQTEYKSTAVDVKVSPLGWIDISTIGGQQILPLGTDTITTFHFLNDISKEAIAICTLNTAQNAVTSVQYKAGSLVGSVDAGQKQEHFNLFPNPAHRDITLRWKQQEAANVHIVVSDVTGRQLYTLLEERVSAGPQLTLHSLPNMKSGLYLVQVFVNCVLQYTDKLQIL